MPSIKLSPKHAVLSACLLLVVLASGIAVQITAQPTTWTISLGIDTTNGVLLLLVNGMSFCIPNVSFSPGVNSLDGLRVYEGACSPPGPLVGPITGTLTVDASGPGPFSLVLVYSVGFPGLMSYHSEWKITGVFDTVGICTLTNVVSDASLRGTGLGGVGLDLDLRLVGLEPASGACSMENSIVWLPTFVYSVSPAQTVCAIQLGVKEPNGTVSWLPGYGYPDLLPSECQNKTEVLGQDVLGRTIVLHQFNQTM